MKRIISAAAIVLLTLTVCYAKDALLLDGFDTEFSLGEKGTVAVESDGGSSIEVLAEKLEKHDGKRSMRMIYDARVGGHLSVARGINIGPEKKSGWVVDPDDVEWYLYDAISFYWYGTNNGHRLAFDIRDHGSEVWRFVATNDFEGWKQIICPFDEFFVRADWQPDAVIENGRLDFPLQSFQFEPVAPSAGITYVDTVELLSTE